MANFKPVKMDPAQLAERMRARRDRSGLVDQKVTNRAGDAFTPLGSNAEDSANADQPKRSPVRRGLA